MPIFKRGDLPEAPPEGWSRLGLHPTYRMDEVDPVDVERLCREAGVGKGDYGKGPFKACVDTNGRRVIISNRMDDELRQATLAHEYPHTWGLTHGDRHKGWVGPNGVPIGPLTPELERALRMRAAAEAQARNIFAQAQPQPQTPGNIFRGGQR